MTFRMPASTRRRKARRLELLQGIASGALVLLSFALLVGALHWEYML
jgi:transcriptional regulator GlxA family with amidase domain